MRLFELFEKTPEISYKSEQSVIRPTGIVVHRVYATFDLSNGSVVKVLLVKMRNSDNIYNVSFSVDNVGDPEEQTTKFEQNQILELFSGVVGVLSRTMYDTSIDKPNGFVFLPVNEKLEKVYDAIIRRLNKKHPLTVSKNGNLVTVKFGRER